MPYAKSKKSKPTTSKSKTTKRSYKRTYTKRRYAYFPLFGSNNTRVQRTDNIIPPRQLTKLRYAENFAISCNGTTGLISTNYTYSLSSVYDPRIQLGGGQPQTFDILAPQYDRYLVLGAKVKVTFSNPEYDGMVVGVRLRSNTDSGGTSGRTIDEMLENRDLVKIAPINNTGSQVKSFQFYVKPWQILGLRAETYKSDIAFSSTITASPIQFPIIEPFAAYTVTGSDATIRCYVEIQYYTLFSEKNTLYDI